PQWDGSPEEHVESLAGIAEERAAGPGTGDARSFALARGTAGRRTERPSPGAATDDLGSRAFGPRASAGATRPATAGIGARGIATRTGDGPTSAGDVASDLPGEDVVEAAPVAEEGAGHGITGRALEPAGPGVGRGAPSSGGHRASTPEALALAPRQAPHLRRASGDLARLLVPAGGAERRDNAGLVSGSRGGTTSFVLTTAHYGSGEVDWDTHKTAMHFLAWQLRERIGFNIDTRIRVVPLESPDLFRTPWIFMSGHKNFRLPDAQVANLRRYLLAGGSLWADDSTHEGDRTWDTAFRREITRVLPPEEGHRIRRITQADNHPLFRSCFDLSEGYAGYFPPPGDKYRQNHIEGIEIEGRLAVIYTRNDYGDGLEIAPDTFPLKASLSGLSPAEMQDASFMMACNVILHILTGGQGAGGAVTGRAAESLRRHRAAQRAKPDPYAEAPAVALDDFAQERWAPADDWDGAGWAVVGYALPDADDARGRRLVTRFRLREGQNKVVLVRDAPEEIDLSGQDRLYVDVTSQLTAGARLSVALVTLPGWKYFESVPAFIKPGRNRVHFDLRAATWKTGDPVPEGQSEHCRQPQNISGVRRLVLLLYPIERSGTVIVDRLELRARP
ncbi:DUF4159 domain-containing protein, partial [bacterium]|nr:DUF4159 domain-containing protein [bacterium]